MGFGPGGIDSPVMTASAPRGASGDLELVRRAARGEEAALAALYDRYASLLYGFAFRIAGEGADAEEIVLDAFSQAWRDAGSYEPGRGSVAGWLTMICRSRAIDLVRARGRRSRLAESAGAGDPEGAPAMGTGPGPADRSSEDRERHALIDRALSDLAPPQRVAVELAFYDGLSHAEIAERLGEPLGTVKTRVRLGLRKLRDALRPYYPERGL